MLLWLRGGTEAIPSLETRAAYIAEHALFWRAGWMIWMIAALSLVAFYAWWGGWISSSRAAITAFLIASLGLACDLFAEALFIGWLPTRIAVLSPLGTILSGGVANALYTVAGIILTIATSSLGGLLRIWAWTIWITGFALTTCAIIGNSAGLTVATAVLLGLLCPWVALFGWSIARDSRSVAALKRE